MSKSDVMHCFICSYSSFTRYIFFINIAYYCDVNKNKNFKRFVVYFTRNKYQQSISNCCGAAVLLIDTEAEKNLFDLYK